MFQPCGIPADLKEKLDTYQTGLNLTREAQSTKDYEHGVFVLETCFDTLTLMQWPDLWIEITITLAEAYRRRLLGDPLLNAQQANQLYHHALVALGQIV